MDAPSTTSRPPIHGPIQRRCLIGLALAVCLLSTSRAADNATTSQTVYVAVESALIYAGPSKEYYPTSQAMRGIALEVYQQTADGWMAVRPPEGSFSWIPASQAYLLPGGKVIEVTDAKAVSWIGTELGSAKQYRWQVQLNPGEQLQVLGESNIPNGHEERSALWYRILPPAGEFRWIESSAVSKTPPEAGQLNQANANRNRQSGESSRSGPQPGGQPVVESPSVRSASFEQPVENMPTSSGEVGSSVGSGVVPASSSKSTAEKKPSPSTVGSKARSKQPSNSFEDWVAFEYGAKGWRSPFLDKLSGRDTQASRPPSARSPQHKHDPLAVDPFSLDVTGQSSPKPTPTLAPRSQEVARERGWRDPRELQAARTQQRLSADERTSVQPASSVGNRGAAATASPEVQTAGYSAATGATQSVPPPAVADVNWYGYQNATATPPNSMPGPSVNPPSTPLMSSANSAELQLALSAEVARPIEQWNLAPLAERARALVEHGATAIERGQARLLLDRIDEFQNVVQRSGVPSEDSRAAAAERFTGTLAAPGFLNAPLSGPPGNSPPASHRFDATGWLVPVHAAGPNQPTHAITNDAGDVIAYVSGIAGLNLDLYRNQPVGIMGLRGYLPQLRAAHIQATQVSRLK